MHRTDPGSVHQASVPVDECCEKMAVDTSKKQNPDGCSEGSICCYAQDLNTVADSAVQTVKETDCIVTTEILSVIPVISLAELVSASYILVFENLPIYLVNSSFLN